MSLAEIEKQVLEELGEDTDSPEVWPGTTDLREALADAIDEMSMVSPLFQREHMIKIEADVAFYQISLPDGEPLFINGVWLVDRDIPLTCLRLGQLMRMDAKFMVSRGTPWGYVGLSPDLLMIYPANSSATDVLKLSLTYAPRHYAGANEFLTIREELEKGLIHYGKYHKLMQVKGSFNEASFEFQEYLKAAKMVKQAKGHAQVLRRLRFATEKD